MRILPVIDLKDRLVVRGVAGRRSEYRPLESKLCLGHSAAAVARGLHAALGCNECYVADLDAIAGSAPSFELYNDVIAAGLAPWIDAGIATSVQAAAVAEFLKRRASRGRVIVGLESLPKLESLAAIGKQIGCERLVFSLDLKQGRPLTSSPEFAERTPQAIATAVVALGVRSLIVLDLAGVGVGQGVPTLELCRTLRTQYPEIELLSGGGVRDVADLRALEAAGCDAALVASALHDGRITRKMLSAEWTIGKARLP